MRVQNAVSNNYVAVKPQQRQSNQSFDDVLKSRAAETAVQNGRNAGNTVQRAHSKVCVLLGTKEEGTLCSHGYPDGSAFYIQWAENSTEDRPLMVAKGIDVSGNEFEKLIDIKSIDPHNATMLEMYALEEYLDVDKKNFLSSLPIFNRPGIEPHRLGFNDRVDFIARFREYINENMKLGANPRQAAFFERSMQRFLDFYTSTYDPELKARA